MTDYRIDKRAVDASIYTVDKQILRGAIYILPRIRGSHASTPERIPDLAADAAPFLPFHAADGRFLLVGKSCIAAVHVGEPLEDDPGFWRRVPAQILAAGGHEIAGDLVVEGAAATRLSDELNGPEVWLRIERDGGTTWVRKACVVTAAVQETG